ncbi:UDP-N-acetylmuramate dehydrogenase [Candidatus Daviesbacteria bacterium]|nr:UDP-N-acetylmuramate dehydrogenase [Candidatus Daviesbacteria bacterium]
MLKFQDRYPLKNLTTLQIGGPAKKFVIISSEKELIEAIKFAKQQNLPFLIIGGGSNLLVSDEGFEGLIIKNEITGISTFQESPSTSLGTRKPTWKVSVKSGTVLQDLVNFADEKGLSGLQDLAGIPGTLGGAVFGNAGAYGQTISDHLVSVKTLNINNLAIEQFSNNTCQFEYRSSIFKKNHYVILEATFLLKKNGVESLKEESSNILTKRAVKYPPGIKCPGSFFKNLVVADLPKEVLSKIPPEKIVYGKVPAGSLLEEAGARGASLGGIEIADYHANLFINKGEGTAKDFYNLAKKYALKVKEKFVVTLEPEVQLINLPPLN